MLLTSPYHDDICGNKWDKEKAEENKIHFEPQLEKDELFATMRNKVSNKTSHDTKG